MIAHRQPFISSIYIHIKDKLINTNCYLTKKKKVYFFFSGIYMLNKVEFLLYKAIVYLHRKKRKNNIHNILYVCLNEQIQE